MKFQSIFLVSAFFLNAVAARTAPSEDKFQTYHRRSVSSTPLVLNDGSYDDLTATPRNYSVAVLLTATDVKYGCKICREFAPEWELVAKSWVKGDKKGESRIIFSTLDFDRGKNTFQKLMIQTAPVLLLFQPTTGPNANPNGQPIKLDFQGSQSGEQIYNWLGRHLPPGPRPPLTRPLNYVGLITSTTVVLGLITFVTVAKPYVLPVIQNRNLWAGISLISVLLFTSGHMFNHIRKVPYVAGDGKGGINYFAGGFSSQYGMETQIVAAIYGLLSFATVSLALRVPRMADPKSQQAAVLIWSSVILGMYSFLLSVFRSKNSGYPFWLPPF